MTCSNEGNAGTRPPPCAYTLNVSSASREEVVTCSMGTSDFCIEASDSPRLFRVSTANFLRAPSTWSLLFAWTSELVINRLLEQFTDFKTRRYCAPIWAIEPSRKAVDDVLWQTSCAMLGVRMAPGFWPISRSVCWTCSSERTLRNGDWAKSAESACCRAPSNAGSPVLLLNPARTIVSFSVNVRALCKTACHTKAPATTVIKMTAIDDPSSQNRSTL